MNFCVRARFMLVTVGATGAGCANAGHHERARDAAQRPALARRRHEALGAPELAAVLARARARSVKCLVHAPVGAQLFGVHAVGPSLVPRRPCAHRLIPTGASSRGRRRSARRVSAGGTVPLIPRYSLARIADLFTDEARFAHLARGRDPRRRGLGEARGGAARGRRGHPGAGGLRRRRDRERERVTEHDVAAFVDVVQERVGRPAGGVGALRAHLERRRRHRARRSRSSGRATPARGGRRARGRDRAAGRASSATRRWSGAPTASTPSRRPSAPSSRSGRCRSGVTRAAARGRARRSRSASSRARWARTPTSTRGRGVRVRAARAPARARDAGARPRPSRRAAVRVRVARRDASSRSRSRSGTSSAPRCARPRSRSAPARRRARARCRTSATR